MKKQYRLTHLSEYFGYSSSHFSNLMITNIDKFNLIIGNAKKLPFKDFKKTADIKKNILIYVKHVEFVLSKMEEILTYYEDNKLQYFLLCKKAEVTEIKSNFYVLYSRHEVIVFSYREDTKGFLKLDINTLDKFEKIVNQFHDSVKESV